MKLSIKGWTKPIAQQWPLMVAYIILIGWTSITKNPIPRWFIIFLHAYLVAALVTWTNNRVVKNIVYVFIYVLFITEIILEWLFGMNISPIVLTLLTETNSRESQEFFESLVSKPGFWQIPCCVVAAIIINILLERNRKRLSSLKTGLRTQKILKGLAAVLLIGGILFSYNYINLLKCDEMNEVDEWRSHMRNPDDLVTKLLVSVFDISIAQKEMEHVITLASQLKPSPQPQTDDSLNIIVVIGESYIRDHAAVYGYPLQTTPFLCSEQQAGRLFTFTDMVTPYNQTTRVIRNLLSCNSLGDGEGWASAPPFTAVFKKNGYHVELYDNQKDFDMGFVFAFSLNTYLYQPDIAKACYHKTNDKTFDYDGELIDYYRQQQQHSKPSSHRLILFHLLGQHVGFEHRYPKSFSHFTADSIHFRRDPWLTEDKLAEIAHYDNATRYNDTVLKQITDLYRQDNTVVLFLSDHGEEVFDYRDNLGRDDWSMGNDPAQVLRYQYMVPFMVWCSDVFIRQHPDMIKQLKQACGRPAMLDNMCQLLFHLSGLNTPYYHKQRDVLSPSYSCPKRLINEAIDCDSIK